LSAKERAYFFFGDDVAEYLQKLWLAIIDVQAGDAELRSDLSIGDRKAAIERRRKAFKVVEEFYKVGQPLFGSYMRFDQKVR
jgi:hypothetical protein